MNDTAIPPLTTEEIFEICRQRLEANRHKCGSYRKIEDKFILTGKIFCGYCGTTVSGTGGTGRHKVYHYYQCNSAKKRHCSQKAISKKRLEDLVIKVVLELLNDVPLVKRISNTCFALQKKKSTKLSALQKEQKLVDFFVNSIYLYDDKFVIMLNFKGGEKTIRFDDLKEGIKKEHPMDECSSLLRCGDPYGN